MTVRLVAPAGAIIGLPAPRGMEGSWTAVEEDTVVFTAERSTVDGVEYVGPLEWQVPPLIVGPPQWTMPADVFARWVHPFTRHPFSHRLEET